MKVVMSVLINEFMRRFMIDKKLTLLEIANELGYKSKTSLDRILHGKANRLSVEKFAKQFLDAYNLDIDSRNEFNDAILRELLGIEEYMAEREMFAFLSGGTTDGNEPEAFVEDMTSGILFKLSERYENASGIAITVMNCQYVRIFAQLSDLMRKMNATVKHYITVSGITAKTIHTVNSIMRVFYDRNYSSYICMKLDAVSAASHNGFMESDIVIVKYTDEHGMLLEDMIIFDTGAHGFLETRSDDGFSRAYRVDDSLYKPIKRRYFECSALENYIQFSMDYTSLEYDKAVYKIKPDIGIDYISASILEKAVLEGPVPLDEDGVRTLGVLKGIYDKRNSNAFSKRKVASTIMKMSAMRSFAITGRMSDHFWGMRAFTVDERIMILTELLKQQKENPFFNIYFLKDDNLIRDIEIAYYEGEGMLILNANTDYNFAEGHAEAIITHEEFTRIFKENIMTTLIRNYTHPISTTVRYLNELITFCGKLNHIN